MTCLYQRQFRICPPEKRARKKNRFSDMAAIDTLRAPSAARHSNIFDRVSASLRYWADVRETRKQLSALSDRELSDIGLVRGDIDRVARGL